MNMSMSKSEFQAALQRQLRNDGVFDEITVAVRSRILQSLLNENDSTETAKVNQNENEQDMALLSLLYHFLEQKGYNHTLSIFAAESKMEHSLAYPLSPIDAIKALGLQRIWTEFRKCDKVSIDLPSLLQMVAHWVSSQEKKVDSCAVQASKSVQTEEEPTGDDARTVVRSSKSIQTEDESTENDKENACPNLRRGYYSETAIIDIENECTRRLRQEMNEKLKLCAKQQAYKARSRLEQKHKEEVRILRQQIEAECSQAKNLREELNEKLSQQKLLAQNERAEIEQRLETISLEKQTLQSEMDLLNERVKEVQKARFNEWSAEQEAFHRKHCEKMKDLDDQRRHLQSQINEVSLEKDAMMARERKHAALIREKSTLLAEIEALRREQTQREEDLQSSFEEAQSDIQRQLSKLQEKHCTTMSDLDASRNEVASLRSLLKQSQTIMESISFREIGKASVNVPSSINSRNATGTANQFWPRTRPISGANAVSIQQPDLAARPMTIANSVFPPHSGSNANDNCSKQDCKSPIGRPPYKDEVTSRNVFDETKSPDTQPVVPEDPPCSSAEDPPEMDIIERNKVISRRSLVQPTSQKHKKRDNGGNFNSIGIDACPPEIGSGNMHLQKDGGSSVDSVVGKDVLVINLSSITEGVYSSEKELDAASTHVEDVLPSKALHAETISSHVREKIAESEMHTSKASPPPAESGMAKDGKGVNLNETVEMKPEQAEFIEDGVCGECLTCCTSFTIEGSLKQSQVDDAESVHKEEVDPNITGERQKPENELLVAEQLDHTRETKTHQPKLDEAVLESDDIVAPGIGYAEIPNASVAESEQYSEHFHTLDEGINLSLSPQGKNHASPDQVEIGTDSFSKNIRRKQEYDEDIKTSNPPDSTSSASSAESSDGYSESFCS